MSSSPGVNFRIDTLSNIMCLNDHPIYAVANNSTKPPYDSNVLTVKGLNYNTKSQVIMYPGFLSGGSNLPPLEFLFCMSINVSVIKL